MKRKAIPAIAIICSLLSCGSSARSGFYCQPDQPRICGGFKVDLKTSKIFPVLGNRVFGSGAMFTKTGEAYEIGSTGFIVRSFRFVDGNLVGKNRYGGKEVHYEYPGEGLAP